MIYTHKQSVALMAGLLLIAAQLVSLVHAAEHPFHAHSEVCASFASLEQHDTAVVAVSPASIFACFGAELKPAFTTRHSTSTIHSKPARGPPLSA